MFASKRTVMGVVLACPALFILFHALLGAFVPLGLLIFGSIVWALAVGFEYDARARHKNTYYKKDRRQTLDQ